MSELQICRRTASLLAALVLTFTSCRPAGTRSSMEVTEAMGVVLAEEAIQAAGSKKEVALITADAVWGSPSSVETAFTAALKKQGVALVVTKRANVGDPMKSGPIGLKPADFFEVLDQFPNLGAVVSLAGAPLLNPSEAGRLKPNHPPVLVVATATLGLTPAVPCDRVQLARLLDAKVLRLAIVDDFAQASAPNVKADSTHQLFAEHYRILRAPD